jgi:hypothetical protein
LADQKERETFLEWQRLTAQGEEHLACARSCYEEEIQHACSATGTLLEDGELQKGLAIASAGLLEALLRERNQSPGKPWKPSSRLARSAVSYFARIALKTSPFSTFTHIDLWDFCGGPSCESRESRGGATVLSLARMLPMRWIEIIARDPELAAALAFELNPTLRNNRHILRGSFELHGSFAWRKEEMSPLSDADCDPGMLRRLQSLVAPFAYSQLLDPVCAGDAQFESESLVNRLLDAQVIRPVAPFARSETAPVRKLAHALSGTGTARATRIATTMLEIAEAVEACGGAAGEASASVPLRLRRRSTEADASPGCGVASGVRADAAGSFGCG